MKFSHLFKNISIYFLIIFLCSIFTIANAQQDSTSTNVLSIPAITLAKTQYQSGSEITGNFILQNDANANASNLHYTITLGEYPPNATEFPITTYETSNTFDPVTINAHASSSVPFKYKLPAGVAGKEMGILLTVYQGNELNLVYYTVKKFEILGENIPRLSVEAIAGVLNGASYSIGSLPTILSSDQINIVSEVSNSTDKAITITPYIEIYPTYAKNKDSLALSYKTTPITVNAKQNTSIGVPLSLSKLGYGKYFATIQYIDDAGISRLSPTTFPLYYAKSLYFIDSMEIPGAFIAKGANLDVLIHLKSDANHAQNTGADIVREDLSLTTSILSPKGKVIAENTIKPSSLELNIPFSFLLTQNVNGYTVRSTLKLGEEIVEGKEMIVKTDYLVYATHPYAYIGYGAIILIILIFILRRIFRKNDFPPEYYPLPEQTNRSI